MSGDSNIGAEHFHFQLGKFGAVDSETGSLVLVVEAESLEQARAHVDAVSPLLGVISEALDVIELDELPDGVPTFLGAFFEMGQQGVTQGQFAPSTNTFQ
jgi:hypothetical protein